MVWHFHYFFVTDVSINYLLNIAGKVYRFSDSMDLAIEKRKIVKMARDKHKL
jgi:hypothetical protein